MFVDPLVLLQLGAASSLLVTLLWVFARHPRAGIVLLLCPGIIDAATRQQTPSAALLGMTVTPADVVAACALAVAIGRLAGHRPSLGRGTAGITGLLALVLASVFRGVGDFGFQASFNEGRPYLCFLAAALYVVTSDLGERSSRFVAVTWIALACVYVFISLRGWSVTGITSAGEYVKVNGEETAGRPVSAAACLSVAQGGLLLVTMSWRRPRYRALAVGLLLVVVLLQHRTVWVVTVVAILAYLVLGRAAGRDRLPVGVAAAFSVAVAYVGYSALHVGKEVAGDLQSSYTSMQGPHSTLTWRVSGWQELLSQPRGVLDTVMGHPFGAGFARDLNGHTVTVAPHNWYIETFLEIGVVGLVLYAGVYAVAFFALRSGSRADLLARLVLLTQLVFSVTYSPFIEQGVALGLVLWHVRRSGAGRPPPPAEPETPPSRVPSLSGLPRSRDLQTASHLFPTPEGCATSYDRAGSPPPQ